MENYFMLDGKKVLMSEETVESMRKAQEKKAWRAEFEEHYYAIDSLLDINNEVESYWSEDLIKNRIGNYFKTEEKAEKVRDKMVYILKAIQYNETHGSGGNGWWGICVEGTKFKAVGLISRYVDKLFETEEIAQGFINEHKDILEKAF